MTMRCTSDSSSNTYICSDSYVQKYDSNFTLQWTVTFQDGQITNLMYKGGYLYMNFTPNNSRTVLVFIKLNASTGAKVWCKSTSPSHGTGTSQFYRGAMGFLNNGNIICFCYPYYAYRHWTGRTYTSPYGALIEINPTTGATILSRMTTNWGTTFSRPGDFKEAVEKNGRLYFLPNTVGNSLYNVFPSNWRTSSTCLYFVPDTLAGGCDFDPINDKLIWDPDGGSGSIGWVLSTDIQNSLPAAPTSSNNFVNISAGTRGTRQINKGFIGNHSWGGTGNHTLSSLADFSIGYNTSPANKALRNQTIPSYTPQTSPLVNEILP